MQFRALVNIGQFRLCAKKMLIQMPQVPSALAQVHLTWHACKAENMDTWSCFQTLHPEFMCCRSFSTAVWSWWLLPLNSGKSLPVLTTNHRLPDFSSRRQYQEQVEEMSFLSVPSRTHFIVVQLTQSCPTLRNPVDCSTPAFPVL